MDVKQLKHMIESKAVIDSPIILKYSDNKFLSHQYASEIAKIRNLHILNIGSIEEMSNDEDLFDSEASTLYIYDVDKLKDDIIPDYKNLIVITKDVPSNLSTDYVDMPKLIGWQIEDFVKMRLPGLDSCQIKWLCDIAKYDIFRIDNECLKLEIFPESMQKIIFDQLNAEDAYCDLNSLTIFNFTNAVMKKDLSTIKAVLSDLKYIDIEGTGLITIFHTQFKKLIDIQFNPKATAESLGINPKQFNAIKYNIGKFTNEQLISIYRFITSLDMRLKNGEFQFKLDNRDNNSKFVEYIVLNLINLGCM